MKKNWPTCYKACRPELCFKLVGVGSVDINKACAGIIGVYPVDSVYAIGVCAGACAVYFLGFGESGGFADVDISDSCSCQRRSFVMSWS